MADDVFGCPDLRLPNRSERMKLLLNIILAAVLIVAAAPGIAAAQTSTGAEARLRQRDITLPAPLTPVANFVGAVQVGNLLFVSGTTAGPDWPLKGKLGKDLTVEQGYQAARQVGLNQLATIRAALGSLDRVKRIVKVLGMVNSAEGFSDQPKVINGFSDLMVDVFGDAGRHARSAVGMAALPGNQPVEVELIVEVE
jgi:enamine deaminase RidA (YjgF/YER057c/UK114 family)